LSTKLIKQQNITAQDVINKFAMVSKANIIREFIMLFISNINKFALIDKCDICPVN